jgi:hypothetical protein
MLILYLQLLLIDDALLDRNQSHLEVLMGRFMHYLLLILALVISSCGKKDSYAPTKDSFVKRSIGRAIPMTKIHPTCDRVAQSTSKEFGILRFIAGQMLGEQIDFSPIIQGTTFSAKNTSFFHKVSYAGKYELHYQINSYEQETYLGGKQLAKDKNLNVCPGSDYTSYPNSFEDASLASVVGIQMAKEQIQLAAPSIKLNPVKLVIGPDYKLVYKTTYRVQGKKKGMAHIAFVNNAFYNGGSGEIVFLPQGYVNKETLPFGGIPLWKIPMVGAHEYGHHVFKEIVVGKAMQNHQQSFHEKFCWDSRRHHHEGSISRASGRGDTVGAFNEGFADLIAFYALGPEVGSLKSIECMEKNREVNVAHFANGEAKQLSTDSYFKFMLGGDSPNSCLAPDYTDIHIIGAIFAHHFDILMTKLELGSQKKLKALLSWAKNYRDKGTKLGAGYQALLEVYEQQGGVKSDACTYLKENATAIFRDLDC